MRFNRRMYLILRRRIDISVNESYLYVSFIQSLTARPILMETEMVRLFILDISGYTRFLVNTDLVHGKETITDILNSLFEFSPKNLVLNKIEGDALFYFSTDLSKEDLFRLSEDIHKQFKQVILKTVAEKHNACPFTLCRHISDLGIKFFIHEGEVAFHNVCNFEELIGKSVIEIHRVMKNSVSNDSYVLTIDESGKYFDKYKYIGKINYDLASLEENRISLNRLGHFFNKS